MLSTSNHSIGYNYLGPEGAKHVCEALKTNSTLVELKYAASHPFPCCQRPLTFVFVSHWQFA